jgi:hypothetical protein
VKSLQALRNYGRDVGKITKAGMRAVGISGPFHLQKISERQNRFSIRRS